MRQQRRRWLMPLLVLVLIAIPILEVWLLIQVGQLIGVLPTVLVLVAEAILGAWLLRTEGSRAWKGLNEAFFTGQMPTRQLTDAALVLVGGVLLILPGFATDVVGFFCLLPFTRPLARRLLAWMVGRRLQRLGGVVVPAFPSGRRFDSDVVIEGETVIEGDTVVDGERAKTSNPTRSSTAKNTDTIAGEIDER